MYKMSNIELSNAEISRTWNLSPILSTWTPETGTIHQTMLLSTTEGNYALRAYRYTQKERSRIVSEHSISFYAQTQGLPAIAPLPLPSGATILEHEGHFYALFPYACGRQIPREQVTSDQIITAMGHCLAELHQLLSIYPHEKMHSQSLIVDQQATFSQLEKIEAAISERDPHDTFNQQILEALAQRRNWLTTAHPVNPKLLSSLKPYVLHGDYQESNLFFTDGIVSAIIDWDKAHLAPRSWEIVRTLHYVFDLDVARCRIFLNAYHEVFPFSYDELDITAKVYGWIQAHNVWPYTSFYLDNNDRVRSLLQRDFTPFEEIWTEVVESFST